MLMHSFSLIATYELSFKQVVRNSFLLSLGLIVQNIAILALAFSPVLLVLLFKGGTLSGLLLGILLFLGIALGFLAWTIYSQWVFDRFINPKIEGAIVNRGIYSKVGKDGKPVNKKNTFKNPKKKRAVKPVTDEEISITELPTAFSRADLKKLSEEKEVLRKDSEEWADTHQNDDDEDLYDEDEGDNSDDSSFEGYEDAMKLEGYDPSEEVLEDEMTEEVPEDEE